MDSDRYVYVVQMPLEGATAEELYTGTGWYTVANPITAEAAGEVVRVLCASNKHGDIRVQIRMAVA